MALSPDPAKTFRSKVQRKPNGDLLGVCVMIGAEDLSFVDSDVEWLRITKRKTENGLILEVGA